MSFAADSMLAAIFRVALKAMGERARFLTLPGPGFRQVHLDAEFLRQASKRKEGRGKATELRLRVCERAVAWAGLCVCVCYL